MLYNLGVRLYNISVILYNISAILYNISVLLYNISVIQYNVYLTPDQMDDRIAACLIVRQEQQNDSSLMSHPVSLYLKYMLV